MIESEEALGCFEAEEVGDSAPTISLYRMHSALFCLLSGKSLKNVEILG
jgi:hypothetical protein